MYDPFTPISEATIARAEALGVDREAIEWLREEPRTWRDLAQAEVYAAMVMTRDAESCRVLLEAAKQLSLTDITALAVEICRLGYVKEAADILLSHLAQQHGN